MLRQPDRARDVSEGENGGKLRETLQICFKICIKSPPRPAGGGNKTASGGSLLAFPHRKRRNFNNLSLRWLLLAFPYR